MLFILQVSILSEQMKIINIINILLIYRDLATIGKIITGRKTWESTDTYWQKH